MNVTENDVSLLGFADKESQTMFRLWTGVSGDVYKRQRVCRAAF